MSAFAELVRFLAQRESVQKILRSHTEVRQGQKKQAIQSKIKQANKIKNLSKRAVIQTTIKSNNKIKMQPLIKN